ncbi:hypothetical protein Acsp03_08410 [Actinomadura sp. NBRC 104412]|uniref:gas vesicle protein GvpO n=1 Tax=Actinomadura sp. NBRC 104412 TaxID=3032203 RepID=UPI0024A0F509|nr:gas vesicle protein GvpO [Actinomadura sp. NBRC 104412]GLZ03374.1 hypothetical protein Acsp03_08410 [Actinomadura sp. NBRC 104412]
MLSACDAAERAVHHVTTMTGRAAECVIGIERAGGHHSGEGERGSGGGWRVTVEVVETHRIPDSADILAAYQAEVDDDGDLVSYRRLRRYPRGRTGTD